MATTNHLDEMDLLRKLQGENHRAFETLYHRYAKPLYWKINGMFKESEELDELVQVLFVKVWEKREQITIEQSFEAYLYKIAQRMGWTIFALWITRAGFIARLHFRQKPLPQVPKKTT